MGSALFYGIGITAGLFLVFAIISRLHTRFGASSLDCCGAQEGTIVVLSSVYHSGGDGDPFHTGRITWIDGSTGAITKRTDLAQRHEGRPRWSASEDRCGVRVEDDNVVEARGAMPVGGLIVVPLKAKDDVIVALDLGDGALRWRVAV